MGARADAGCGAMKPTDRDRQPRHRYWPSSCESHAELRRSRWIIPVVILGAVSVALMIWVKA